MALHKINIQKAQVLWDEGPIGKVKTNPLEGTRAEMSVSSENGITFLKLQWKIKKPPQPVAPLGLLAVSLSEFAPDSMFVCGRRYESTYAHRPQVKEKGFPYNTYYKFHLHAREPYDPALHAKMPLVCWQEKGRAFSVIFPRFIQLSSGRWPVFIHAGNTGQIGLFVVLPDECEVEHKPYGWFSTRKFTQKYRLNLSNEHLIEATFAFIGADRWTECVRRGSEWLLGKAEQTDELSTESLTDILEESLHFYNRSWEGRNRTHMHLPIKNAPGFESVEFKHSHITDDITKLALYRRLIRAGVGELSEREREFSQRISEGSYTYRSGDDFLWHTTTYFKGAGIKAYTHHGIGFVGFPGGMATNVRRFFELYSLEESDTFAKFAHSGAQWLLKVRRRDGSWPAVIDKEEEAATGSISATAESVRALMAAYRRTKKQNYMDAAQSAAAFINRDESFFGCRRYLRDVNPAEIDGISAEACIHANLDLFSIASERKFLDAAEKWGLYALQWVRPYFYEEEEGQSFDGLSCSITPRVDLWGQLLVARALMRLGRATGDKWWLHRAWQLFRTAINFRERGDGMVETWFYDFPDGLQSIHIEPTFVTDALVEFILDACGEGERTVLADELLHRHTNLQKKFPPLKPTAPFQTLLLVSKDAPEFIIDRKLRLVPVFCGPHLLKNRLRHLLYRVLRPLPARLRVLKLVPALKILLNRHQIFPPVDSLQMPDQIISRRIRMEDFGDGRQRYSYSMGYYRLAFSVLSAGLGGAGFATNDIGLDIETTAGDLWVEQVRLDLIGNYSVRSVTKEGVKVASGGADYDFWITSGEIDGIIQQENKLAFDISLSANWNFFGKYHLGMRIERTR